MLATDDPSWPKTIEPTPLPQVLVIGRPVYPDDRGSFQEMWKLSDLEKVLETKIVFRQFNRSVSKPKVLRGLHIASWGKLIHCPKGNIFQVVIDTREGSATFGEVFTCPIGDDNPKAVWVPPGCGNGFCTLGDKEAVYEYAITEEYTPGREEELAWNDSRFASKINWPISDPILSGRDKKSLQQ